MDSYNSLEKYKNNKKYSCIKCGTLIKSIYDGCPKCNCHEYNESNLNQRFENMLRDNNLLASLLFVIAWLTIALGFIFGIVMGGETEEFDFIIYFLDSFILYQYGTYDELAFTKYSLRS